MITEEISKDAEKGDEGMNTEGKDKDAEKGDKGMLEAEMVGGAGEMRMLGRRGR